ncbi:hypothetical protein [Fodinibius salsisoli]|nr:hypothetical protein [Fodinibius salsisoli]
MDKSRSPESALGTDASEVDYSLIYVIHGDGNYLYHDQEGKRLQADQQQLEEAISVARQAKQGEVFIFHQQPEERFLWLFPKKDRRFLYFKNGKHIKSKKYSPENNQRHFEKEAAFYHQFRSSTTSKSVFLYYGHEIPSRKYKGYFQSRPQVNFDIEHFSAGLGLFLEDNGKFDLTVLSTCDNGTPKVVSALQGKTEYLLASPENLHLSHIDSGGLLQLEQPDNSIAEISRTIAEETYDRLTNFLQTVVTITIYDMDGIQSTAEHLLTGYQRYSAGQADLSVEQENTDCATLPFWDDDSGNWEGVEVLFKAPAFGPQANRVTHSGWGCQL